MVDDIADVGGERVVGDKAFAHLVVDLLARGLVMQEKIVDAANGLAVDVGVLDVGVKLGVKVGRGDAEDDVFNLGEGDRRQDNTGEATREFARGATVDADVEDDGVVGVNTGVNHIFVVGGGEDLGGLVALGVLENMVVVTVDFLGPLGVHGEFGLVDENGAASEVVDVAEEIGAAEDDLFFAGTERVEVKFVTVLGEGGDDVVADGFILELFAEHIGEGAREAGHAQVVEKGFGDNAAGMFADVEGDVVVILRSDVDEELSNVVGDIFRFGEGAGVESEVSDAADGLAGAIVDIGGGIGGIEAEAGDFIDGRFFADVLDVGGAGEWGGRLGGFGGCGGFGGFGSFGGCGGFGGGSGAARRGEMIEFYFTIDMATVVIVAGN